MLRYQRKSTAGIQTQSLEEFCECCGEIVEPNVDIGEVTFKPANDNRTVSFISPSHDTTHVLKTKSEKRIEVASASIARGMLSQSDAGVTESLKYELRSEKMCSSSVSYLGSQNIEYCYRMVDGAATASRKKSPRYNFFKEKFEDTYDPSESETLVGAKLGMDRHGKPIRLISESYYDELNVKQDKWYGAHKRQWYRDLTADAKLVNLTASKSKVDTKIQNYMFKESFDLDSTASYYSNDYSILLDGNDDHISCGDFQEYLYFDEDAFDEHGVTVNAWIYIEASGSTIQPILAVGRTSNKYYGYLCNISADFRLQMHHYGADSRGGFGQSSNNRKTAVQSPNVDPIKMYEKKWIMATFVFGSSEKDDWSIWMNGKELTTVKSGATDANLTLTYNGSATNIGKLGKTNTGADSYFNGLINNIGVWKTGLSQESILGLYNDGTPPFLLSGSGNYIETGSNELVAYWELQEGEAVTTMELINDIEGELVNEPAWNHVSPLDDYRKQSGD